MSTTVLALTNSLDESAGAVLAHLDAMGIAQYRFDTDKLHDGVRISMRHNGARTSALIWDSTKNCCVRSEEIGAVWHRRPQPHFRRHKFTEGVSNFIGKETSAALHSLYSTLDHAKWMNPLAAAGVKVFL